MRQALLLTAILIAISVIISLAALNLKQGKTPTASPQATVSPPETSVPETAAPAAAPAEIKPRTENVPLVKPDAAAKPPAVKPSVAAPPVAAPAAAPATAPTAAPQAVPTAAAIAPPEQPKPKSRGTLVFVIDDAGNNVRELEPFLRFPGPLTIAVLPGLPHSAEAARRIRAAGKEVFLHQPMEAVGGQDPGPGAIYAGMSAAEIVAVLEKNIAEIGPIAGMNNHQGSKITMDRRIMETVLAFCHERNICFLDSRTTAETVVPAAAQSLGIKIGERAIFIDNEKDRPSMNRSITDGLALASRNGSAVMIGHAWSPELAPLLAELYQNFTAQGYDLAPASDFIKR